MGGTNSKENLVLLTAREHFVAHAILVKIYPTSPKITNAFHMMTTKSRQFAKVRYYNSRLYEYLKKYWISSHSGENHHLWGITHSDSAKKRISEARKGTMPAKDKNGNIFSVKLDDPRVISGELRHHSYGRVITEKERKLRRIS